MSESPSPMEERVLILMPAGKDGARTESFLREERIASFNCSSFSELCDEIARGAGAVLTTEESLSGDENGRLAEIFSSRPSWSDLPFIVLSWDSPRQPVSFPREFSLNTTLVERPVRVRTLISVVRSALRARQRQYEIRNALEDSVRQAEALRESREWLSTTLSSITDAVIATDRECRIVFMNRVAQRLTGWTMEEARGLNLAEVFDVLESASSGSYPVIGKEPPPPETVLLRTRGGGLLSIEDSMAPLWSPENRAVGSVVVFRDVTERRKAERAVRQSERLYRAIGESLNFGIWICDAEGRNTYASESILRLVGMSQQQWSGFGWFDALHPDDTERVRAAWLEMIASRGPWDAELRFLGANGMVHPVLSRGVPVTDEEGKVSSWVGINLDIARSKRTEEELRAANRSKDEFLAMLAHELRNPLGPIRNGVQILQLNGTDSSTVGKVREMIDRQVQHMTRIVDDLLDVSRISRGKVKLKYAPVDLRKLVAVNVEDNQKSLCESGLQLSLESPNVPVWVSGDQTRLAQVLDNLLQNARKFTESGGHVRVLLSISDDGKEAVLRIKDTGVGIEPALLPRLFEPFTQGDRSLDRSRGGLGLGLSLVKGLVQMHGGSVSASSAGPGEGAEFTVRLPRIAEPAPKAADTRESNGTHLPPRAKRRVLVVEDNRDSAESLKLLLELSGFDVSVAHSGPEGVVAAGESKPDAVICDIGLPGMDGFAVAAAIRSIPETRATRLIALTGYGSEVDAKRSTEAGFDAHLVKPVDTDLLLARLGNSR